MQELFGDSYIDRLRAQLAWERREAKEAEADAFRRGQEAGRAEILAKVKALNDEQLTNISHAACHVVPMSGKRVIVDRDLLKLRRALELALAHPVGTTE